MATRLGWLEDLQRACDMALVYSETYPPLTLTPGEVAALLGIVEAAIEWYQADSANRSNFSHRQQCFDAVAALLREREGEQGETQ